MRLICKWGLALALAAAPVKAEIGVISDGYHVFPGDDIQGALEAAALNPTNKIVKVHPGLYRPRGKRQALIWFNRRHDGIRLEAVGEVTLTAANPDITNPRAPGFPAVVNHVVYFGDGISSNTVLTGFRITGANEFVTEKLTAQMEPDTRIPKNLFFYTDGGAIKVFGHSSPVLENLEVVENYASPCGAGISVQQESFNEQAVLVQNCRFIQNRAQVTGSAVDLLAGSAACLRNCLFVGNRSNTGKDIIAQRAHERPFTNSGVLTIFQNSRAQLINCTFTGNRNGVDDLGGASVYTHCIFADNMLAGALEPADRYELDLPFGARVSGCVFVGKILDPQQCVDASQNTLNGPKPMFDAQFVPQAPAYKNAGYRPASAPDARATTKF